MATCITCLFRHEGGPFGCPSEAAMRATVTVDSILFIALFTIGILAVIGSGTSAGHPLHDIGSIGALGGSLMMAGGVLIGLPGCCCILGVVGRSAITCTQQACAK